MNKRKEDRLIQMAFGEFGDREENHVEKESDRKTMDSYSDLRKALASAREIPEHQLSNERLRHAILGEGLHQARAKKESDMGWLWNTLGFCGLVAAFILVLGRHAQLGNPQLNLQNPQSVAANDLQFGPGHSNLVRQANNQAADRFVQREPSHGYRVAEYSGEPAPVAHRHRAKRKVSILKDAAVDPNLVALKQDEDSDLMFSGDSGKSSPVRTVSMPVSGSVHPSGAVAGDDKKSGQDSVVEIEQDQDDNTGARAAREIASKNVVFGG